MRDYHMSREFVLFDLPEIEGRAYCAWSLENNGAYPVELASDGYMAQERFKML